MPQSPEEVCEACYGHKQADYNADAVLLRSYK